MMEVEAKVCPVCGTRYDAVAAFCQRDGSALVQAHDEPDAYIGRVLLEQFRIEERVGSGGMGTVYRAHQMHVGRDVAIKILHPELIQNPDAVRRFRREARVSASLDHPNVVRTFLFGQLADDSLYLVMEFLRGRSLMDLLRTNGALDPARALHIATQICDGVGEAHRNGVVHRDVKPENVLLVTRGHDPDFVKVLDFGIARFVQGEQTVATQSGLIFGTARYISPEGAQGEPTDTRSDVYSIAVLTYQLLCGETPFDASSPVGLLMRHIHDAPPDIRRKRFGAHVPGEVADVIMRCLAKNPDARLTDANELGSALRAAASSAGIDVATPRYSTPPMRSTPTPARPMAWGRATPTPPTGPMPGGPSGAGAPSPFHDTGSLAAVSGLPRGGRALGALGTVLLAFVLGAGAVVGGAWVVGRVTQGSGAVSVEDLESRARAALARGDIDTPPGDNVADLTGRILEREPAHAGALSLRGEAARRLREEGAVARSQGFVDEARSRYRRALALAPDDLPTQRALAELERAATEPEQEEVAGIRVVPDDPQTRQTLTFIAGLDDDVEVGEDAEPHFHIERGGRRLTRAIGAEPDEEGHYVGTYRFGAHGTFDLVFMLGEEVALRREITVERAATAQRRAPPRTTVGTRPRAEPAVTMDDAEGSGDGIDWRLPEERDRDTGPTTVRPPEPDELPEPPAEEPPAPPPPWSSGGSLL